MTMRCIFCKQGSSSSCSVEHIIPESLGNIDQAEPYEVLHEFDILVTPTSEYYIVVAIFGEEFALNLGGPEIDGHEQWLRANNDKSPLYIGRNV